jgi:magnesium transporter
VISGGSDHLHYLLGQSKYQLMMGLIPLSTAISGNVALQSSSLTIRAMNHGLIGRETYATWIFNEVGAAMYLGFAMGAFVSVIALLLSRFHFIFASVVLASQFLSIATASLTGTLTPLLCEYFFEHNGKKWGGAIETAIQDLIGSFVMIAMTYKILEWFGPLDAQASNSCVRSGLV